MQLNLGTKKNFSEANMRRIISILTGLMSSVSSLEDQCIKEYNDTVTYQKGQIVIGSDGYFYEAKTVATGTWDSSKWTKIGTDDITELDVDTIKGFLGLTQDQLDTLAKIISDDTIELSKTWSSSKIYTDIQDVLKEAKQYCITELAKKSTGSFKKANDTTEVTDGNYLYLILNPSTSKYDIYALVDSNVELLTSVDVNLDNYYTKTEVDNDFLKKSDAASTYATKSEVADKFDKANVLTAISDTPSDEKVLSEKAVSGIVTTLQSNFQDGVNTIYDAVVAKGVTPTDKSPSEIADAISKLVLIKGLIPAMTSATTPSGSVTASSYANGGAQPYYAFCGDGIKYWASSTSKNSWLRYDFDEDTCVKKISFKVIDENVGTNTARVKNFRFEASSDGSVWNTLYTGIAGQDCTNIQSFGFDNIKSYKYYRIFIVDGYTGTVYNALGSVQMYGVSN